MKRHLISTVIIAAASSGVLAQSTVTIFGVADATIQYGSGSVNSVSRLGNSGLSSSLIGFRGIEDLGDGMKAAFWLESSVATDSGVGSGTNTNNQTSGAAPAAAGGQGLTFGRRSTVSIGGNWGELRVGRDYSAQYVGQGGFDPFGNVGVGVSQTQASTIGGLTEVRASNTVAYLYGHPFNGTAMGTSGFNMQAMYYFGENNSNSANPDDGSGYSLHLGYVAGPLNAAVSSALTKYLAGDIRVSNVAFFYEFGVAKLFGLLTHEAVAGGATSKGYLVGGHIPVGRNLVRVSYSHAETDAAGNPGSDKFALGYVYNLSKRTALYTTIAHVNNSGPATQSLNGSTTAAGGSSTGYDLGLKYSF